jgi:hypothetical protein
MMHFVLGVKKCNRGWTPLHLAAYFGHAAVVRALLQVFAKNYNWKLLWLHLLSLLLLLQFGKLLIVFFSQLFCVLLYALGEYVIWNMHVFFKWRFCTHLLTGRSGCEHSKQLWGYAFAQSCLYRKRGSYSETCEIRTPLGQAKNIPISELS